MPEPCGRGRGIARVAWRGCAAARRRAKPGAVAQLPPGAARGSGRSQPHRDAQPHQGEDGALRIGAMARQAAVEADPDVARGWPLLTEAIGHIAHPQIRNRGTVGGSLAHNDPAAELPAVMLALDAEMSRSGPTRSADHRGRGLLRRDDGDGARARRASDRDQLFRHSPRGPAGAFRRPRAARGISRSWRSRSC